MCIRDRAQINQAKLRTATEVQFEVEDALGSGVYEGADSAQATLSLSWALEGKQIDSRVGAAEARQSLVTIELERQRFDVGAVSYTHLRAHETSLHLVCRLLLEKNFFF